MGGNGRETHYSSEEEFVLLTQQPPGLNLGTFSAYNIELIVPKMRLRFSTALEPTIFA